MTKIKQFRKINNTRSSNQVYELNQLELTEYAKCYNSFEIFYEKIKKIQLLKYQKDIIDHYLQYRYRIDMFSREMEMDEIISALYLWQLTFNPSFKIILFGFTRDSVTKFYNNIFNLYKSMPTYMQLGLVSLSNGKCIEFDNGSLIEFKVYTPQIALGKNYDAYIFNDAAFYYKFESFYKSVYPAISARKNTSITISSTPNGYNYFYTLVEAADRIEGDPLKNKFICKRAYWWEVPGRDEKWKQERIKNLGSEKFFDQEYNMQFKH